MLNRSQRQSLEPGLKFPFECRQGYSLDRDLDLMNLDVVSFDFIFQEDTIHPLSSMLFTTIGCYVMTPLSAQQHGKKLPRVKLTFFSMFGSTRKLMKDERSCSPRSRLVVLNRLAISPSIGRRSLIA